MYKGIYIFVATLALLLGPHMSYGIQEQCDVISLDTIVNKTKTNFIVATTDAPLYIAADSQGKPDQSSLVGALETLDENANPLLSLHKAVYLAEQNKPASLTIGTKTYPLYINSNTALKAHFATRHLSASACTNPHISSTNQGPQTLILFPQDWQTSCQPAILIGKNNADGTLLALTYFVSYKTIDKQIPCCWLGEKNAPCTHDMIFRSPWNNLSSSPFVGNLEAIDSKPLGGSPKLKPGRIKIVIDLLDPQECTSAGWASQLQVLPNYFRDSYPDFSIPTISAKECSVPQSLPT